MSKPNNDSIYISVYTRQNAIADGVLIDLMQPSLVSLVKQAGFCYPLAMTSTAFSRYVEFDLLDKGHFQSIEGRLWDVLCMLALKLRLNKNKTASEIFFTFVCLPNKAAESKDSNDEYVEIEPKLINLLNRIRNDNENFVEEDTEDDLGKEYKLCKLKAVCGGDDNGEPCITIMLPSED
jgi:hypothetical protein